MGIMMLRAAAFSLMLLFASSAYADHTAFHTFMTGGVLRNFGDGWVVMDDGSHKPLNINEVITTPRYVEVRQKGGDFTVSAIVTVDNDLAAAGYTVGLSGGREKARIVFFKDGSVVDPRTINIDTVPLSNVWFLTVQGVADNQTASTE